MIAQVQPRQQQQPDLNAYCYATVKYGCKGSHPDLFNPDKETTDIVVTTNDGVELKIWGEPALLRQCHKGCQVILRKGPRAKNWKIASDRNGNALREIPDVTPIAPTPKPAPKTQVSHQAIAGEITALAGLYAQCYQAAKKELTGLAPEQTIQGAASSLFIQMNRVHNFDTLIVAAAESAKADLGF